MSQAHCTTKERCYTHLSETERGQIQAMVALKVNAAGIAQALSRDVSTIYRELKRNSVDQMDTLLNVRKVYYADTAQKKYVKARMNCGRTYKLAEITPLLQIIEELILTNKWSPDAAVGYLRRQGMMQRQSVTTRTLYTYIRMGLSRVKPLDLHLQVRRRRRPAPIRESTRENSIDLRDPSINERREFGRWEMDTLLGKRDKGAVLFTLVERMTRQALIVKLADRTAASVVQALDGMADTYGEQFSQIFKSITSDNGSEFAFTAQMERPDHTGKKRTLIFYAHPYCSGERGSNENVNGLIRRFLPKGRALDAVSNEVLVRIQDWINSLPRRILDYLPAQEAFAAQLALL